MSFVLVLCIQLMFQCTTTAISLIENKQPSETPLNNFLLINKNENTIQNSTQTFKTTSEEEGNSEMYVTTAILKDENEASTSSEALTDSSKTVDQKITKTTSIKLFNKMDPRKRKIEKKSILISPDTVSHEWKCPNISSSRNLECGCDMPHTLRCSGDIHSLEKIADGLRKSAYKVSLLDCTLKNVTFLSDARIFENVSLHGLVISSGEIKRVHRAAFLGLKIPLQAIGLPNNALPNVPMNALSALTSLDRLDLSNNNIKTLGSGEFLANPNLTYLELSENQISRISLRTFGSLKKLTTLKLNGNRLGDFSTSLLAIGQALNLKEIDLKSNSIKGPLSEQTLPTLPALELLNLDRNLLTSIQNGAFQNFPFLITLSLRHNQIDVLQDHAFSGLSSLQSLDLGYNGIVAVSGASLQHLGRLLVLDLTHNFLRALTSDLIAPLPALRELRLDGNDISIVAKNALDGASELHSLSLQDNPLSCDCTLKPFAEWLLISQIPSQDLLGTICATPPHLEGAPLLQIPVESLNCDMNSNEFDNINVLQQLEDTSKQNNMSHIKDYSDVINLKNLHLSADYGMILTWSVNMRKDEFSCDTVFVYKETNIHEILLDNSPVKCESTMVNDENIVSVILHDTSGLVLGESYRFCLVLLQEKNIKQDLVVGCSNITKLEVVEQNNLSDQIVVNKKKNSDSINYATSTVSDISSFDRIGTEFYLSDVIPVMRKSGAAKNTISSTNKTAELAKDQPILTYFSNLNRSFLPGLGLGIIIASVFILIWGATKLKRKRQTPNISAAASTCYAAPTPMIGSHVLHHHHHHDSNGENRNRYLKLQATTSL